MLESATIKFGPYWQLLRFIPIRQSNTGHQHSSMISILTNVRKSNRVCFESVFFHRRNIFNMTNKPRVALKSTIQTNGVCSGPFNDKNGACSKTFCNLSSHNLESPPQSTSLQTMAGIQRLAHEPTREQIDSIRNILLNTKAKNDQEQEIVLDKNENSGIATVCIRSAAKNGISGKMMCDLLDVIDELYAWPAGKGVIIYGHDGFFCSGGDLVSVKDLVNYEDGLKMATLMQYNLSRLQTLPMVTMALIQGKAIGGGAEIAVTTDLRAMTKSAKIGYVHCRVGICSVWGGGSRLVQLVGPSRALDLMSSGRLVGSSEAIELGLVNNIIDDDDLNNEDVMRLGMDYLKSHLIGAKSTIIAIKALVNAARTLPLDQALVAEGRILGSTWGKQPHLDALCNNIKHRDV